MASDMSVGITFSTSQKTFGGPLEVNKFWVRRSASNKLSILFLGTGYLTKASMSLSPELAIALARDMLSVAEGYVSKSQKLLREA